MIDNQAKRLAETRNVVPEVILIALFAIAAVSCGFAAYAARLDPLRTRLPVFITATVVGAVIFIIIDLDSQGIGFINWDLRPMIDLVDSLPVITD